jgi:molybdopterin/thiamine biosynthesis adenylyltransferase
MEKRKLILDRSLRIPWFSDELIAGMRVAVIGTGNTGCSMSLMLYGLGPKELWLIDRDTVEIENVQRQFLFSENDVGRPKAHAAMDFLLSRYGGHGTEIHAVVTDVRYTDLENYDFVFCCVDNNSARRAVLEQCLEKDIPLIDTGLDFRESQAGHAILVDRQRFPDGACVNCYMDITGDTKRPQGCVAAAIPYSGPLVAGVAAGMFVQHVHGRLRHNFFFFDLNSGMARFGFIERKRNCEICGVERE